MSYKADKKVGRLPIHSLNEKVFKINFLIETFYKNLLNKFCKKSNIFRSNN